MAKIVYFLFEYDYIKLFLLHLSKLLYSLTMKKFGLLLLIAFSIISCENTEINEFAMQANIDNRFYTSNEAIGTISEDGSLSIVGSTQLESITLRLTKLKAGNYNIGRGLPNSAVYKDMDGKIFRTAADGNGSVTISKVNEDTKTFNGSFHFRAILPGVDTVYVSRGVLYNVSYNSGDIGDIPNAGTFSAKVDNEPFVPSVVSANKTGNSIVVSGGTITSTMSITVPSNVEVGDYLLSQSGYKAIYQNENGAQSTSEGIISITEHNQGLKSIKGTFSFLTDQSEITEGKFEVVYL